MSNSQFIWYMVVNIFVAFGTVGAVIVALFGRKFFPPKLEVELANPQGEFTSWTQDGKEHKARYYQVQVRNKRRWSPASDVSVHIVQMLVPGPDTILHEEWQGDVPITWKFRSSYPEPNRVGKPINYDLVSVNDENQVSLHPIAAATSFNRIRAGSCRFAVLVQAKSAERDSKIVKINVSWDGIWERETEQMARHFFVTPG